MLFHEQVATRDGYKFYSQDLITDGLLRKLKAGRSNYYINEPLYRILTGEAPSASGP